MVSKWEIFFCSLDPTQGSEQRGMRPVLIVSSDAVNHALPVSTVLPLSSFNSGDKIYPSEILLPITVTGLPKESVAMVQQIRTVSHTRLTNKTGAVTDPVFQDRIRKALRMYFEL